MDRSSLGFESWWPLRVLRGAIGARRAVRVWDDRGAFTARTGDSHARRPTTPIGARGETASSKNQVMTYPDCVGVLKPSPPTVCHGQGLA